MSVPYTVIAKYPYTPSAENASDDLAFRAGQLITVTDEVDADWLFGTTKTGGELVSGYFPRNFVEKQAEDEPELPETAAVAPDAPDETQSPAEPKGEPPVAQPPVPDPVSDSAPDPVPESVIESIPEPSPLRRESTEPVQSTIEHGTSDFKHKLQSFNVSSAPPMPGQTIADPNFTKKPFVAASPHSTYISPLERRETRSDERRVSSGSGTAPPPPLPAQSTADEPTSAEEDAPRLTLKERLRLLEERQREEQAAAEALMKRREEKKKKEMLKEEPAEENDETEQEEHKEETEHETATEDEEDEEDEEEAKRRQLRERMAKLSGGMGMIGMMGFGAPMPTKEKKVKESKRTDDEAAPPDLAPVPVLPIKPEPQDPATAAPESAGEESEESNDHESVDLTKQPDVGDEEDVPTELEEPKQRPSAANPTPSSPPPIPTSPTVTDQPASFYAAESAPPPPPQDSDSESDHEYKSASSASPTLPVPRPVAPVPPLPAPVPTSQPAPAVAQVPRVPTSTAPPVPPVPAVPPVPPPMSDSSEEVVTGYEADDDTDIAQAEKPVDSPVRPPHAVAPPPPPPVTKAPTAPLPPKTSPAVPAARLPPPIPTSPLTQTGTHGFSTSSVQKERRVSGSKTATSHAPPPPPPPPVAAPVQTDNTGSTVHSGLRSSLEISDYGSSSKWWLTKSLPSELSGKDVYYEVDSHEIRKRNGKTVVYLDYYIVNQDYSTKIWEMSYDAANPDKLATFVETVREKPATNSTYLLEASRKYGAVAFQLSSSAVGSSKIQEDLVSWVFKQLPRDVMPAVGSKTFGATIYRNTNNVEINQLDEIRPGDVLVVLKGRFEGHSSGPFHKSKTAELGFSGKPYTAILAGFDPSKGKMKVIEQTAKGVQSGAYKLGDFKSGKIRIFRIVGRDYFGW
ncbi:hypothetical protein KL905_003462 [Ogataea polymorpha]|nr:hypothetical protein KL905_003462 [Ogataea polymorpha]KAG7932956.1 hypothetical protein KL934_003611 [Ogataea polymorpha]